MGPTPGWDPRISVNSLSSARWSLTQDLDLYQRLDIHRVSFFLPKLIEAGLERAIEEIVGRGIDVDAVLPGAAFDLSDQSGWTEVHEAMFMAIEVAERLGATTMPTAGGSAHGQAYHWAVDRFARAIEPVVSAGRQRGVRVAIEPTRTQFAYVGFVHSLRDALALADHLDLWLMPDTAHVWWEPDLAELLAAAAPRFALFQVADLAFGGPVLERLVPGDGELPLGPILTAAAAGGFEGPFEVEILGQAVEDEGYDAAIRRSYQHIQGLLAEGSRFFPADGH
ncbi:MAG TPA: sugar phosphate isomerase/epimerase family protein [Acidimicrobiales bacterium]|nr:sugar phosphate isomerase/epimerase family protein [Acidimicrobiales bacterium]